MKKLMLLLCFLVLAGCDKEVRQQQSYFFEFDAVDHYKSLATNSEIRKLLISVITNKSDSLKGNLLLDDYPYKLSDTSFIGELKHIKFEKVIVSKGKLDTIRELFKDKKYKTYNFFACIAEYRDILIFRKNKKITGIAKICFGCGQHVIIGAKINTENFGQGGDYKKLRSLLYPK